MAQPGNAGNSQDIEVGYLTDVEGNLHYFDRWVPRSGVLRYRLGSHELELTHERAFFVYGGDVMDRFDGSLRLTHRLVSLKRRYPDRVFLLAGNRDLNKVRLTAELSDQDMARSCASIPRPHWDPNAPTLSEYLSKLAAERNDGSKPADLDSKAARLRYMLMHTLGCPDGFELRRRELQLLDGRAESRPPSDEEVVASMLSDIAADSGDEKPGILRKYLMLASLVCILGNTLFVHGALDPTNIGIVPEDSTRFFCPSAPQPFRKIDGGPAAWAEAMNALLQRGLAANAANPGWDEERSRFGGEVLAALQNQSALSGRCAVSGAYSSGGNITTCSARRRRVELEQAAAAAEEQGRHSGNLFQEGWLSDPRDPSVASWLLAGGIRRVVVGHKPSGDSPAVLCAAYTGVEVISADTSYADTAAGDGRGASIAGVSLVGPSLRRNAATVFGVLRDGREHCATLAMLDSKGGAEGGDMMVGRELEEDWWCKAKIMWGARGEEGREGRKEKAEVEGGGAAAELAREGEAGETEDGTTYLCCRGHGRVVEYCDRLFPPSLP